MVRPRGASMRVSTARTRSPASLPTRTKELARARAAGARTILNLAPMVRFPIRLMKLVDVAVLNEIELGQATGARITARSSVAAIASACRKLGPPVTIANQVASITAEGNGATTSWTYEFLIPTTASCVIQVTDETVSDVALRPTTTASSARPPLILWWPANLRRCGATRTRALSLWKPTIACTLHLTTSWSSVPEVPPSPLVVRREPAGASSPGTR